MNSSRLALVLASLALLLGAVGCSHQAPPAGSAADVAHPAINFSMRGPPPVAGRAEHPESLDSLDRPIVDARHGWSHETPR
jgi:hypothetical protein